MAKLLTYYDLCTITDHKEFLGLSEDCEPGSVINTLGRNIFQSIRLSNQQHIHSGTVLEKLSNKIVFDFNSAKYVAVFATRYLRVWSKDTADINRVKKIKIPKNIHDLVTIPGVNTLLLYKDGTTESLKVAIESRKSDKDVKPIVRVEEQTIHNVAIFTSADQAVWLSYFAKNTRSGQVEFIYFRLHSETLIPFGKIFKFQLARTEQQASLIGYCVVDGEQQPSLVTIWTDKRIFMLPLQLDDSTARQDAPGFFVAMLNLFKVDQPLAIAGVSKDCVAIYGANEHQEGASLVLYNTRFSVPQSKQFFKVFFDNAQLWVIGHFILLAYGQTLACVSFRISKEQLSDMIGSQRNQITNSVVDKDCINEENDIEAAFEFDSQLQPITNGHSKHSTTKSWIKTHHESLPDAPFQSLYDHDVQLSLNRGDILLSDTVQTRIGSSAIDEVFSYEEVLLLTAEMEKNGSSEFEISEKCIPLLIKGQLSDELIKCLRRYTNISDKQLVKSLKYFLNSTDPEDGLNVVFASSFSSEQIKKHLRSELNFDEVLRLLKHIHALLESDDFHQLDNVQFGDGYNADGQLLSWFSTIIDANYQQFVLSRNRDLLELVEGWKGLIDDHLGKLNEVKSLSSELYNLVSAKALAKEKQSSKWYSVETIKLY